MKLSNLFAQSTKHLYNTKWNQIGGQTTIKVDGCFYEIHWFNNKNFPLYNQNSLEKIIKIESNIHYWIKQVPSTVLEAICIYKGCKGGVLFQLLRELSDFDKMCISCMIEHLTENSAGVKEIRSYNIGNI